MPGLHVVRVQRNEVTHIESVNGARLRMAPLQLDFVRSGNQAAFQGRHNIDAPQPKCGNQTVLGGILVEIEVDSAQGRFSASASWAKRS